MPQDTQETDWTEWQGGECPVYPETRVHYRLGDGYEDLGPIGTTDGWPAGNLRWSHVAEYPLDNIIAYRVSSL